MYPVLVMPAVRQKTKPVSFRTSDQIKAVIEIIAETEFGGNQTSAIEAALIEYAKRKKLLSRLPSPTDPPATKEG